MSRLATIGTGLSLLASTTPALAADTGPSRGEAQLTHILDGRTPGRPEHCIRLEDIESSEVVDGTAIVYEGLGGRLYVNRPASGANTLRHDDILVSRTSTGELCNIDTVRLVESGSHFDHGFVGLSDFIPYDRPGKSAPRD